MNKQKTNTIVGVVDMIDTHDKAEDLWGAAVIVPKAWFDYKTGIGKRVSITVIEEPVADEDSTERTLRERVQKLDQYIALYSAELSEIVGFAAAHGWQSTRYAAGKKLRREIKKLRTASERKP